MTYRYHDDYDDLDGPSLSGWDHICTAVEYGQCACTCHDLDDCGCECCNNNDDSERCDYCEAVIENGHGHYPYGQNGERICTNCHTSWIIETQPARDTQ